MELNRSLFIKRVQFIGCIRKGIQFNVTPVKATNSLPVPVFRFVLILVSALSGLYAGFFNVAFHFDWQHNREHALLVGSRKTSSSKSAGGSGGGADEDVAGKMLQVHVSLLFHGLLQLTASLTTCLVAALFARTTVSSSGWSNSTSSSLIACAVIGFVHLLLNIGELVWLVVLVLRGIRWY